MSQPITAITTELDEVDELAESAAPAQLPVVRDSRYPSNWFIAPDLDPKTLIKKVTRTNRDGKDSSYDYVNVQDRLLWFIRDQRELIARGLAVTTYVVKTELIEHDREKQWAHFKTYIRDVLGNEATMYGQAKFKSNVPDYPEMASTKSLGRGLLMLGYGTGFAPEMDEDDDNLADAPVEHRDRRDRQTQRDTRQPARRGGSARVTPMMTAEQRERIVNGSQMLGLELPADLDRYTEAQAQKKLDGLAKEYHRREREQQPQEQLPAPQTPQMQAQRP